MGQHHPKLRKLEKWKREDESLLQYNMQSFSTKMNSFFYVISVLAKEGAVFVMEYL